MPNRASRHHSLRTSSAGPDNADHAPSTSNHRGVIETAAATLPNVRAGKLKAYGVSLARGTQLAPEIVPFEKSAGLTGFDVGAWLGIMVPAGTPKPIVDRLAAEVDRAMKSPEAKKGFDSIFVEVDYRPTEEFARTLKQQKERFAEIIRKGNIKVE